MCVRVCVYTHVRVFVCMRVCIHERTMYMYLGTCTSYMYLSAYVCVYMNLCIHVWVCVLVCAPHTVRVCREELRGLCLDN